VFHIFAVRHPRRDELRKYLLNHGIKTEVHYPIPPHKQEAMKGILAGEYPISEEIHATELSLPISAGHTVAEIEQVCGRLSQAAKQFVFTDR
jgi:dTDP-4-amino-4,6-dideoxygalactose transaminase